MPHSCPQISEQIFGHKLSSDYKRPAAGHWAFGLLSEVHTKRAKVSVPELPRRTPSLTQKHKKRNLMLRQLRSS